MADNSSMKRILIIEDDVSIQKLITHHLRGELNVELDCASNYLSALSKSRQYQYDLFLLDLNLEGYSGFDLLEIMAKNENLDNRVIVISADLSRENKIKGYELGVSNFVSKPLDMGILKAIMRKNLKMLDHEFNSQLQFGQLRINEKDYTCFTHSDGTWAPLKLTQIEFRILSILMRSKGNVVTKDQLITVKSDRDKVLSYKSLEVHISNLRKKIEHCGIIVKSVWGVGYSIEAQRQLKAA